MGGGPGLPRRLAARYLRSTVLTCTVLAHLISAPATASTARGHGTERGPRCSTQTTCGLGVCAVTHERAK